MVWLHKLRRRSRSTNSINVSNRQTEHQHRDQLAPYLTFGAPLINPYLSTYRGCYYDHLCTEVFRYQKRWHISAVILFLGCFLFYNVFFI